MARLVVLRFEDNDEAEEFVNAHKVYMADEKTNMHQAFPEVLGLLAMPTQFCEQGGCGKGRIKEFARGTSYGWWVCARCHKPSGKTTGAKLWRTICSQARNLLPDAEEPAQIASPFDSGWGVYGRR